MASLNRIVSVIGGVVKDTITNPASIFIYGIINVGCIALLNAIKDLFMPTALHTAATASAPYVFAAMVPGTIAAGITYKFLVDDTSPSTQRAVNYGMVGAMAALGAAGFVPSYANAVKTAASSFNYAGLVALPTAIGAEVGEQVERHTRLGL